MPQIWTDEYIWQLHNDADADICNHLDIVYTRFHLHVLPGVAVYTLPDWVRKIDAIYYKGKKVDPISYESMILFQNVTSASDAYYYCLWPTGSKDIRLHPAPNLEIYPNNPFVISNLNKWRDSATIALDGNIISNYMSSDSLYSNLNEQLSMYDYDYGCQFVIVAAWRLPEPSTGNKDFWLPEWMVRRTKKAYVLSRAYAKEGSGQNLVAAKYFKQKYDFLITAFKAIFDGSYVAKRYRLATQFGQMSNRIGVRPPKPALPSNFERVYFK